MLLGWRPTRWRHVIRQQFAHTPAMIRDPSGHRRGGLAPGIRQTRMRGTEIIDRPDQVHPMVQRQCAARQCTPSTSQRYQTLTKRRVQPLDVRRVDHAVALGPTPERLNARWGAIHEAAFDVDDTPLGVALHDLGDAEVAPRTPPRVSLCSRLHGGTQGLAPCPDVSTQPSVYRHSGWWSAQARTRSRSRRLSAMARCAWTAPANPKRVQTSSARAIPTMPPWT